ncbi:MAG: methyltransferase domain-containing protein [Candidatus Nitrospinota bacterium M3_3B_026]
MKKAVQDYYGRKVTTTGDLEYDACCTVDYDEGLLAPLTSEVKSRRYGCGSPTPEAAFGLTILDLGCGAGTDVFIASQLVGPAGKVIGVDMTGEQLEIARRNVEPVTRNIGYDKPNVEFLEGEIESLDLPDESVDIVISNCVINLSEDKEAVFGEIWRALRPGGEFLIADIVADRRIPEPLRNNPKLYSECLTGADYEGDFLRRMSKAGFNDVRQTSRRATNDIIETIHFTSVTYRGFKIPLEEHCEDYGQVAVYKGAIPGKPDIYTLDLNHVFPAGAAVRVCKNTADIIRQSRLSDFFHVSEEIAHLGRFDCSPSPAPSMEAEPDNGASSAGSCC